ncbi:MAG: hypothetical protein ABH886_02555 [Candidatus Desantisbacteria bacterium]
MEYPWYEEVCNSTDITQGDIIVKCPIPLPDKELFEFLSENKEEPETYINLIQADVMVLSQACDIVNNKIDSLVVCPIWSLRKLMESNEYFKSSEARESLRQGKEPAYHLLNEYSSDKIKLEYSIVDFHRIYSLPKDYIKNVVENINNRLRLLPPYREHLSQAFARYFMRVGLPMDIDKNRIKNI